MPVCSVVSGHFRPHGLASLLMEFFRHEYLSGLPFSSPEDLPNPGIKPTSLAVLHWQADSLPLSHPKSP